MHDRPATRRRTFLAAGGLALTALAGCTTGSDSNDGTTAGGGGTTTGDGETSTSGGGTTTDAAPDPGPLSLRPLATGFSAPLDLVHAPDAGLYYVADQPGLVSTVDDEGTVEPALDLRERVVTGGEQGLLGLALHPGFAENRRLFVRYSAPRRSGTPEGYSHTFVLSEFQAVADGGGIDPDSERTVLEIPEPQRNHNGGSIVFGPDDLLYVAVGDGGGAGDTSAGHVEGGNAQDVVENLLGSILRIDIDATDGDRAYGVPDDNPLVGEAGLDEHFAWGLRNPWRMSFDGDDLYAGDVGQNAWEEVDLVQAGGNYGWNVWEGTHCYEADTCPVDTPDGEPFVHPVIEYPHGGAPVSGSSVIGGYVARGEHLPDIEGRYVFGDLDAGGRLFAAEPTGGDGLWPVGTIDLVEGDRDSLARLFSFGRDAAGRLYALGRGEGGGGVYELRPGG